MLRTTLKSILAHKWRLASTTLAIVLGVAFVTGTFILTDTLGDSFEQVFSSTTDGIDLAVRGKAEFVSQFEESDRTPVPQSLLDEVRATDGVAVASGEVAGVAILIDRNGEPVISNGPPSLGVNGPIDESLANSDLREGRYPEGPDEIAIDAATVTGQGYEVGSTVGVIIDGPVESYTLVGSFGFGEIDNLAGATVTMFAPDTATELYGQDGFTEVYILAEDGVDLDALADRVATVAGSDFETLTGEELAQSVTAEINDGLAFFTTALLVFAGVSLFVGAFLIANTFSIIVAQRTRELALLRAIGASRGQVLGSVLTEAIVVGLIGSVVGLVLGIGVSSGLKAALGAFGIDLPSSGAVIAPRTIVVAFLVGVGITVVSALMPAIRSTRVPPVAALQAVVAPPVRRYGKLRYVFGGLVLAGGIAMLAAGLFSGAGIAVVGGGAVVTLFGAAALSPLVSGPVVSVLGTPIAATRGLPGTLARENALRSPRRTAATASALMIGVALVSFTFIMAASVRESAVQSIDEVFLSEFQINPTSFGPPGLSPFPAAAVDAVRGVEGVAVATPLQFGEMSYNDGVRFVGGIDPDEIGQTLRLDFLDGDLAALADGGLAVSESQAEAEDFAVGDPVQLTFSATGAQTLEIKGIFDGAALDADWIIDDQTFAGNYLDDQIAAAYVSLDSGVSGDDVRPAIEAALEPFPTVQIQSLDQVKDDIATQINQLLGLLNVLLALSVIIALFGIVNTLALSVLERIRELGLLRAVGASRGQIRSMVRWEAVLIALLGAVLGGGIGTLFGWMVTRALRDQGISAFVLPGGQLFAALILAALAGVVAAIVPARRAARTDILRALEAQ